MRFPVTALYLLGAIVIAIQAVPIPAMQSNENNKNSVALLSKRDPPTDGFFYTVDGPTQERVRLGGDLSPNECVNLDNAAGTRYVENNTPLDAILYRDADCTSPFAGFGAPHGQSWKDEVKYAEETSIHSVFFCDGCLG